MAAYMLLYHSRCILGDAGNHVMPLAIGEIVHVLASNDPERQARQASAKLVWLLVRVAAPSRLPLMIGHKQSSLEVAVHYPCQASQLNS